MGRSESTDRRMEGDEARIIGELATSLGAGAQYLRSVAASPPADKGAYLLLLRLDAPLDLRLLHSEIRLCSGYYVYAGNAYGSGGIGARLRRHLRRDKRLHRHIDRLTGIADAIHAFAVPDGHECVIVAQLLATGRFDVPVPGFGSSDCRHCEAHLLRLRPRAF